MGLPVIAMAQPAGAGDCEARVHWIDGRLARTAHRARVWSWGWGTGLAAAGIGSVAAVPFVASGDRVDWYVGATTSFAGLIPLVVLPLAVMRDSDALHAEVEQQRASCVERLADAEQDLARDADSEAMGRAWWVHGLNVLVNVGAGALLGFGYHHWTPAVAGAAVGITVGEIMIETQPTETVVDREQYRIVFAGHF